MKRIEKTFYELKQAGRKGLVGYLTAGDPDPHESERRIRTALEGGVDVLELGIPFSDPTADGPVIQAAARRALDAGMTVGRALDMVRRLRRDYPQPIVLFGYANPFLRYGYERLAEEAAEAGADGVLAVDVPFEERDEMAGCLDRCGLCFIPLVAPTTSPERMRTLLAVASGFVYYIMVAGVTGKRAELSRDIAQRVQAVRACTRLPVAVGFGVSDGRQAAQVGAAADAVVVGSALIEAAQAGALTERLRDLRSGLDGGGDAQGL